MFESSMMFGISDYAMKTNKRHGWSHPNVFSDTILTNSVIPTEHEPGMWNDLRNNFLERIQEVNADLKAAGLPELGNQ